MLHQWILPPTLSHNATKPKITSQEDISLGPQKAFLLLSSHLCLGIPLDL